MKLRSRSLRLFVARGVGILCAIIFLISVPSARADSTEGESPAEGAWWAFHQRAYPLADMPEGAQMRALRQTRAARAARSSTAGGAAPIDSDRWVDIGPAPIRNVWYGRPVSGRVTSVAVDPGDGSHWVIGTAGGVWETRDGGATWRTTTDDQASLTIGAVTFAASNPRIIYAGTGEANFAFAAGQGLLKSTDGGTTWVLLATSTFAGTSFSDIKVHPTDPTIVVAATARGFAGRDAGERDPLALPSAPPRGIFTSADGGVTWVQRLNGEATDLKVDPGNFSNQYAGVGEVVGSPLNGVYCSTDAGVTWTLVDGPWRAMAGGVGRVETALAPSNPNVLYVSIQDAIDGVGPSDGGLLGLFRTDNAWAPTPVWVQIPTGATDDGSGVYGYCAWVVTHPPAVTNQCWISHTLSVDPTNPDVLYAGGIELWKFDGTSWTEVSQIGLASTFVSILPDSIHSDQHGLTWAGNRLIVGNDGGVWSTTDAGATWTDHNTNLATIQFYKGALHPTNPNFVLAGSQDNGIAKWTGTDSWDFLPVFVDGVDLAISYSRPDTHWAITDAFLGLRHGVGHGGSLATFLPAGNGIDLTNAPFAGRFEKCPADEDVFIAGTDNLWRTTEFFSAPPVPGPTWSANGPEMGECVRFRTSAGCITALAFAGSDTTCNTYAFATGDGRLRRTVNGGSTWDDLDANDAVPDRFVTDLAFAPTDANTLYVTLSGFDDGTPGQPGHVFKTMNALAAAPAWLNVSPPVDQPQNSIAVDPVDSRVVYLGADTGVWQSRDGAATWTHMGPESGMPNVAVYDLEIHPTVRRPFAFTFGRGAFMLACRSDAECDDQNARNGTETCDLVSGRCLAGVVPPTPTPTPSVTPTLMATPTVAPAACSGDCDGQGSVTVDEIITLVNIALGNAQASACPQGVPSGAGVDVTMIIQAVNHALNGCGVGR